MWGLLNIDKPYDITSRGVVDHVQRLVRPEKAGHAGTLDPLATGVLVVCVGAATRLIDFVQAQPKAYVATFLLGRWSETEDTESPVTELVGSPIPSQDELVAVLPQFRGQIAQRPPVYSALKVRGRRAYALARRGQHVELAPRPVVIYHLEVLRYDYPELTLAVECGSGTYIRSLGRDIGAALGTAAVMSALRRTRIGGFSVDAACPLDQLTEQTLPDHLLAPIRAVEHLPQVRLDDAQIAALAHGRAVSGEMPDGHAQAVAVDGGGNLLATLRRARPGVLQPERNFVASVR